MFVLCLALIKRGLSLDSRGMLAGVNHLPQLDIDSVRGSKIDRFMPRATCFCVSSHHRKTCFLCRFMSVHVPMRHVFVSFHVISCPYVTCFCVISCPW